MSAPEELRDAGGDPTEEVVLMHSGGSVHVLADTRTECGRPARDFPAQKWGDRARVTCRDCLCKLGSRG